jgi:hypothetical protein
LELSALSGAVSWWQDLGWIRADPIAGLRHRAPDQLAAQLSAGQVSALFRLPASLREQTFWRLLYDSGAPAAAMLALDAGQRDLAGHRARRPPCGAAGQAADIAWGEPARLFLRWLLARQTWGPVFITSRRTGARTASAAAGGVCQMTGQVRLSYRGRPRYSPLLPGRSTRPVAAGPCTSSAPHKHPFHRLSSDRPAATLPPHRSGKPARSTAPVRFSSGQVTPVRQHPPCHRLRAQPRSARLCRPTRTVASPAPGGASSSTRSKAHTTTRSRTIRRPGRVH